jgi:O-acetyl-ADP-ribose deacetylase (regulator of RNase III)
VGGEGREACQNLPVHKGLTGYAPGLESSEEVRVPNGSAVPTPAFNLPCKWVLHTAGPVWPSDPDANVYTAHLSCLSGMQMKLGATAMRAEDQAKAILRDRYKMPMITAVGMGLTSIAYPAISAGVYGCPQETCAEVALSWAARYIDWPIDVTFYLYPAANLAVWKAKAEELGVPFRIDMD